MRVLQHLPRIEATAACKGHVVSVDVIIPQNEGQQSVNRVSTILGVPSCIIEGLCYSIYP